MQKVLKQSNIALSDKCVAIKDIPTDIPKNKVFTDNSGLAEDILGDEDDEAIDRPEGEDEDEDEVEDEVQAEAMQQDEDMPVIIAAKEQDGTEPKLYRFPTLEEKINEKPQDDVDKGDIKQGTPAKSGKHKSKNSDICDEMVDKAVQEASHILEDAHERAQNDYNLLLAKGRNKIDKESAEAREMGYAQGMQSQIEKVRATIESLESAVATIEGKQEAYLASCEQDLKWLALEIAQTILHDTVSADETKLAAMVKAAIASQRSAKWLTVELSSTTGELLELLQTEIAESDPDRIKLKSAADLPEGTCRIQMPDGFVDASIYTQIDNLKQYFSGE